MSHLDLINQELKKKKRKYTNSGSLVFTSVQLVNPVCHPQCFLHLFMFNRVTPVHSFMDYVKGGCQISLIVAIDFTVSMSHDNNAFYHTHTLQWYIIISFVYQQIGIQWKSRITKFTTLHRSLQSELNQNISILFTLVATLYTGTFPLFCRIMSMSLLSSQWAVYWLHMIQITSSQCLGLGPSSGTMGRCPIASP